MSKEIILTAKDLSKTFSNESVQQHVLKNLNLNVYKGDFTVVMGNSGSGKSTLLYALSGMDRPTLGSITYFVDDINSKKTSKEKGSDRKGIEISKFSNDKLALFRRYHAGFVFQQNYLNDSMSALDNVMVSGLLRTKDRKALAAKSKELLKRVEIEETDWRKFPTQLSGGQQQRTSIGRAIVKNPDILLCDEPTGALDYKTSKEILKLIEDVNQKYGNTIIMVTHNEAIKNMADHIVKLRDGVVRHNDINDNKISAVDLEW